MKNQTWQRLAVVAGAFFMVSGVALGQGDMRDTLRTQGSMQDTTQIPGDAQFKSTMQDTTQRGTYDTRRWNAQDSLQGGTLDTMYDHNRSRTGRVIDSTRQGVGNTIDKTKDSMQGSTDKAVEPDNTGINKRDRKDSEVTADEQGQSSADIEMTRKIRRAIMDDDALSTYAKNIKIITRDGMVTLKGPVRSEQEKSAIEAKAAAVAGAGKIKDQIEVKAAHQRKND